MVPAMVHDKFVIRFCVVAQHATEADIGNEQAKIIHFIQLYFEKTRVFNYSQ